MSRTCNRSGDDSGRRRGYHDGVDKYINFTIFFQYHTFLEETKNETTVMTIHRSLYKLFWTKENGPGPLA